MPYALPLLTADGPRLHGEVWPGPPGAPWVVVAHGFTVSTAFPPLRRIAERLSRSVTVLAYDARGHGRSEGLSTLSHLEVLDVDAAVAAARAAGAPSVAALGFSMGAAAVLRHAARVRGHGLRELPDAVVAVSGAATWSRFATASRRLRLLHLLAETRLGRAVARRALRTRVSPGLRPFPAVAPEDCVRDVGVPLLLVHGERDPYFDVSHAHRLASASGAPLWLEPGVGHAELAVGDALVDRIAAHVLAVLAAGRTATRTATQEDRAPGRLTA